MTSIAPHISAFLQIRLPLERQASAHTCDSYAYAFQLLFEFISARLRLVPSNIQLEQIDAQLILAFLQHLESDRKNQPISRNARLAAIKSFMRFVNYRVPSAIDQVRSILAIPFKKTDQRLITHLTFDEMQAVIDAPDPSTRKGIRDRAMLHLGFTAGLRVSELVGLAVENLSLNPTATVFIRGKGRRERALPLTRETVAAVRAWMAVRGNPIAPELFLSARGEGLTRSGFEYILRKHSKKAASQCSSLVRKRLSPHVMRHTCAMIILQATHDIRKVSLWLGHASMQSTEAYTQADPMEKLEAIEAITPPALRRGRFKQPDKLLALLHQA
jgi:integrase/recombinase XerD